MEGQRQRVGAVDCRHEPANVVSALLEPFAGIVVSFCFDDSKTRGGGRVPSRNTPLCDGHHPEIRQFVTPITRRKAIAAHLWAPSNS